MARRTLVAPARPALLAVLRADAPVLLALLALAMGVWMLAYQAPLRLTLAIGGDNHTHRREDDRPFLLNVNGSEPADPGHPAWPDWWEQGPAYRWTRAESALVVPGIGGGPWRIAIRAGSGRPDGSSVLSRWLAGGRELPLDILATERVYHLLVPGDAAGDLVVQMQTVPYYPPGDQRELGFVIREVRVAPAFTGWQRPALPVLAGLGVSLVVGYGLGRSLALARRPALVLGLAAVAWAGLVLATSPTALTLLVPALALLALVCVPLTFAVQSLWRTFAPLSADLRRSDAGPVAALVALAFVVRMAGMLHPHAIFSDHRLNANNLFRLLLGYVYFTTGLPAESGGGQAPYPPGLYLLLAPFQLLVPSDIGSRVVLVQTGTALLDSLVVALLWLLLRRAVANAPAALFGALAYLLPPPLMASFSVGEYANLGGQVFALAFIALVTGDGRRGTGVLVIMLAVGLLGHFGVAITLGLFVVGLGLVDGLFRGGILWERLGRLGRLGLIAGLGGGLAALVYYSAPLFLAIFGGRLAQRGGEAGATGMPLERILAGLSLDLFASWSRLSPLVMALGLGGAIWLWLRRRAAGAGLRRTLGAWWLAVLLAQGLLLIASQGVRWQHFLYPALCLGIGLLLAACLRRGRFGRIVALTVALWLPIHGLILWINQIRDYLH